MLLQVSGNFELLQVNGNFEPRDNGHAVCTVFCAANCMQALLLQHACTSTRLLILLTSRLGTDSSHRGCGVHESWDGPHLQN